MTDSWVQIITILVSNLAIILTFFGLTVSINNNLSNQVRDELKGIREEIRDFHERLLKIEMDKKK